MPEPVPEKVLHGAVIVPADSWRAIITEVAQKHGLTRAIILGPNRGRGPAIARQEAAFRMVFELGYTLPRAGRILGRDHSTILHSIRKHAERSEEAAALYAGYAAQPGYNKQHPIEARK